MADIFDLNFGLPNTQPEEVNGKSVVGNYGNFGGSIALPSVGGIGDAPETGLGWKDFLFGKGTKDSPGQFGNIVSGVGTAANIYLGLKSLKSGEKDRAETARQFDQSFAAQQKDYFYRLETRGKAQAMTASNEQLGIATDAGINARTDAINAQGLNFANQRQIS